MRQSLMSRKSESLRAVRTAGTGVRTIDSKFQCSSFAPADQGWSALPAEKQEAFALVRTPGTGVRTIDSKFTNSKLR